MIRRIIVALVRLALRIYFQRIEVTGLEHVPTDTPVIFVLNHPNALVDPVFLLCLAPRRVSFLAKAPLFRMPVIGYLVKAMDSLPVYRRQDEGEDVTKNQETFVAARKLLAQRRNDRHLPGRRFARRAGPATDQDRRCAYFSRRGVDRRSLESEDRSCRTLLHVEDKLSQRRLALFRKSNRRGASDTRTRRHSTARSRAPVVQRIEKALREVILDAKHEEELQTTARAERIFSSASYDGSGESLKDELRLQQRFIKAYSVLQQRQPERLRRLELRMIRFEEELNQAGVDPDELSPPGSTLKVFASIVRRSILFLTDAWTSSHRHTRALPRLQTRRLPRHENYREIQTT